MFQKWYGNNNSYLIFHFPYSKKLTIQSFCMKSICSDSFIAHCHSIVGKRVCNSQTLGRANVQALYTLIPQLNPFLHCFFLLVLILHVFIIFLDITGVTVLSSLQGIRIVPATVEPQKLVIPRRLDSTRKHILFEPFIPRSVELASVHETDREKS
jgi:hypothetical protein